MADHYNKLGGVFDDEMLPSWRFRVKILRVYKLYYEITGPIPYWVYVLADEHGGKIEMTIDPLTAEDFEGLEKQEGKWVEIFRVKFDRAFPGLRAGRYRLTAMWNTKFQIIYPPNSRHYMEFKNIHRIADISYKDRNYPIGMISNH
ncbi:unnamed protein product [Eruca vesicaria subsp. sativa]|uniref:Replication protein A 70 kDa DNA-binding subunit B/D first OB fold domain-containing protein n=1 Tax=Eruca vesicaria subsp. sativa TaxID=29727 RepID=A0ABC8K5F3_ERUVS|nr:unnamed protein product [Eruca vesicaria subsp. sativa]